MSWTAPRTWVAGETLTGALLNTHLRDNMLETEAAKATGGGLFFGAAANSIVERRAVYAEATGSFNTSSGTYTGSSPAKSCTTSDRALVFWSADFQNSLADANTWSSVAVSGASTIAADDDYSAVNSSAGVANRNHQYMQHHFFNALTPGSNTFTMQYRTTGAGTGTWSNRRLLIIPM